ncbi:MAG: alpha-ketoglutarate-dependent dioxygenase AlkB [Nannocystaceae bacterium]
MSESLLDGRLRLYRGHFAADAAGHAEGLRRETRWLEVSYDNQGRAARLPRWTANYGERSYDYSGLVFAPEPWTPRLAALKAEAERLAGVAFNAAIVQLYRDGRDGVGWHADESPAVGRDPVIASLSFGAARRFQLRPKGEIAHSIELLLEPGDLLIMGGDLQHTHLHRVPREGSAVGPRINVTFRAIVGERASDAVPHAMVAVGDDRG